MCGIAGIIDYKNKISNKTEILMRMSESLSHRGPDEHGLYISAPAYLAHRRLSVIDPVFGKQPMTRIHNNKKYTIVYNGEIYNAYEIKKELSNLGYEIKTNCDTEIVLLSFIEYKENCLKKLNGIFSFAIYSEPDETLFIARDRIGVKPLFYSFFNDVLIFASEIKGILKSGIIKPQIDKFALAEIFLIGPGRTPGNGIYRHIDEIKPGHCAYFSKQKGLIIKKYWDIKAAEHTHTADETAEYVKYLVSNSIKNQLVSDKPVCTFLSGGLDSSIITAITSKEIYDLHSFSVNYSENDKYFKANYFQPNSDDKYIGIMSRFCCSKHHVITLDIDELFYALEDAVYARDFPGMADVDSSLYLFCKEIKKHATVALSGECADEIFGGYPWYHNEEIYSYNGFPWSRSTQDRAKLIKKGLLGNINSDEYVYKKYRKTIEEADIPQGVSNKEKRMREMFMLNFNWFMQTLLDRKDRMSMASGLEVRVPFCDYRIVEYAYNIPWEIKAYNNTEKGILRKAMKDVLPDEILQRKKSPYPKTYHPLYMQLVKNKLTEIINNKKEPLCEIADTEVLKELIQKENMFETPMYGQLMALPQVFAYLIQINYWLKINNPEII